MKSHTVVARSNAYTQSQLAVGTVWPTHYERKKEAGYHMKTFNFANDSRPDSIAKEHNDLSFYDAYPRTYITNQTYRTH